uniref:Autophagy protein 5 n=1 Tax=Salix viminalis TaxID=40686 RepID=A0A6N2N9L9_SALVM
MMEAQKYVWEGAIPLQIHLHESEITSLPPPSPALILAPRIGYLPLLLPLIKPYFSSTLPPGQDTLWFDYKGLPLKWYIPTGVLFDLLCAEPERPWNLTVHFRGYPSNLLIPCEGEESVKWSFINSLKEADYIINGNCKNVMNMSQSDQVELWRSVMDGNLDKYIRSSSKLKLGTVTTDEADMVGQVKFQLDCMFGVLMRTLKIWKMHQKFDNWDQISYINRPLEIHKEGKYFTLHDALKNLLPEFFAGKPLINDKPCIEESEDFQKVSSEDVGSSTGAEEGKEIVSQPMESCCNDAEIKLIRIQGIEPKLEIPFSWVVTNLKNPEHFLHICVCVKIPNVNAA